MTFVVSYQCQQAINYSCCYVLSVSAGSMTFVSALSLYVGSIRYIMGCVMFS